MKAGRELDALVAEKVMGYEFAIIGEQLKKVIVKGSFGEAIDFSPTTNIADAWKVVEKFNYKLSLEINGDYCNCKLVGKFNEKMVGQFFYGEADSVPLAICLAALKAVGVEV